MASVTKELGKSLSGIAQAVTASTQGVAQTVVSLSSITTNTVDGLGNTVSNLTAVSTLYTDDLVEDVKASNKEASIKRGIKLKALESVANDEATLGKATQAMAKSIVADILEDLE